MQIRTRLTIQFALLVSGILLVSFLVIYYSIYQSITKDFYFRLSSKALSTAELLRKVRHIDNELLRIFEKSNRDLIYNENILIFDDKNRLLYANSDATSLRVSNYWLDQIRLANEIHYKDGKYKVVGRYYKIFPFSKLVVILGAEDIYGDVNLSNLRTMLAILYIVVTVIVAVVGWLFSERALLPISRVMNEVEGILPQKLDKRLDVPNQKDEIGRLTATFNQLLDRIENAFRMQKTFVANVSHELKNPLTKISSQLEVSLLKVRTVQEYQGTVQSVLEDIRELSQLSNTLLELAKVSDDHNDILTEKVRLDELLWDTRKTLLMANKEYRIFITLSELPDDDTWLEVNGNSTLLKTAFINLMDNACKFSEDNRVEVGLYATRTKVEVIFSDRGKGIAPQEQAMVFQPFYRGDNTASVKGYGIGLSLVERIIKVHNGSISVESRPMEGTTFKLQFYRL